MYKFSKENPELQAEPVCNQLAGTHSSEQHTQEQHNSVIPNTVM